MVMISAVIGIIFLGAEIFFWKRFCFSWEEKERGVAKRIGYLEKEKESLKAEIEKLERKEAEQFLFYDLARRFAPLLNKEDLFNTFSEEVKYLGMIEKIGFSEFVDEKNYLKYPLEEGQTGADTLCVKTSDRNVIEYLPFFAKLLRLCLERIKLYEKAQQLSIYDSLTGIYNRRYFMHRFIEEFNRAEKFKHNLSFLMIDIDNFKAINDTYGHLVGDVVLKEVARLVKETIREVDFAARFGGEEFAIILLDTDKAGAIMAGDRICFKIARDRISVFDEMLVVSVSVGIAVYPQNSIHSDMLIETADKALYKAKLSGKNRACWF